MILGLDMSSIPELPISYITIVLIVFMLLGFISGLIKGFGIEFLGLLKMAGVIFGAAFGVGIILPLVGEYISFISSDEVKEIVIYIALFIVLWIVLALLVGLIKRLFLRQLPGGWSKFFGGIIGMLKAGIIAIAIIYIYTLIAKNFSSVEFLTFFVENAKKEPVGRFLVENNIVQKVVDIVKEIISK